MKWLSCPGYTPPSAVGWVSLTRTFSGLNWENNFKEKYNSLWELPYEKNYNLSWLELVSKSCWSQKVLGTMQSAAEQNPQPSTCGELCWSGEGTVQAAGNKPVLSNPSDVCQTLIKGKIFLSHRMVLLRKEITALHQDQDITVKIQRKRCSLKRLGALTEWT